MITWAEFRLQQRQHAENTETWASIGRTVYGPEDRMIARCETPADAERIVRHQNFFGVVCNLVTFLNLKLKDARANKEPAK